MTHYKKDDELSLCPHCYCMTKTTLDATIPNDIFCGNCGQSKVVNSISYQILEKPTDRESEIDRIMEEFDEKFNFFTCDGLDEEAMVSFISTKLSYLSSTAEQRGGIKAIEMVGAKEGWEETAEVYKKMWAGTNFNK